MADREMTLLEVAVLTLAMLENPGDLTPTERDYVIEDLSHVVSREEEKKENEGK